MIPSTRPHRRPGFTLIEVLLAMAIFAIGFVMVSGVVPAGLLLSRRTENDVMGILASRNVGAIIVAKKVHSVGFEHCYSAADVDSGAYKTSGNQGNIVSLAPETRSTPGDNRPNDGNDRWDMEDMITGFSTRLNSTPSARNWPGPNRSPVFKEGPITSGYSTDNGWVYSTGYYPDEVKYPGRGRGGLSPRFLDLIDTNGNGDHGNGLGTYDLNDLTDLPLGRIHVCHNRIGLPNLFPSPQLSFPSYLATNNQRTYFSYVLLNDNNCDAENRNWVAYVVTLKRNVGDLWPERGTSSATPGGVPSPGDGGDGGREVSDVRNIFDPRRELLKSPNGTHHPSWKFTVYGSWNTFPVGNLEQEPVSNTPGDPAIPGLYNLPMIVYDRANSLIEVAYPDCWTPDSPWSKQYAPGIDRRMAVGDQFIAQQSGTIFTVINTQDVDADKHHQLVQVSPPISNTLLGDNVGNNLGNPFVQEDAPTPPPAGTFNWRLRRGFFAPRPVSGGSSPIVRIEIIPAALGFTSKSNH